MDRKNKILYTEMHDAELIVPGYEYLLFTIFYEQVGDNGIYKNRGVFTCPQIWTVPLDISNEEYQKILKINHFDYIEHDEICQKAIEKYINGNK